MRLDANENAFFQKELEHVKAKAYDVQYPELKFRKLIPVSHDAPAGAESITYHQYDMKGIAKIIGANAKDLPRVDIKGKPFTSYIRSIGAAFGYTINEIRASLMAGKGLEQRKANAARRAVEQALNTIAFTGDATFNLGGLLTNANVPVTTAPAGAWSGNTNAEILADLTACADAPFIATKGVYAADTLLLPLTQYRLIANTRFSDSSDKTILEFFLSTRDAGFVVDYLNELDGAGTAGADVMVAYKRDPEVLTQEIPQEFEQFAPQWDGLEAEIPCHARAGGVIVYQPLAVAIYEGI